MTYEQLKAFAAVVESGSFRAAAEQLHKTQSTISAAIANLESQFSLQLLDRSSYRPTLTPEGKSFYQQAKRLLQESESLERLGHQLTEGTPPSLSIALSTMSALPEGLSQLKQFCDQHPRLQLNLSTQHLSGLLEQLDTHQAELAIGPNTGLNQKYESIEIFKIRILSVTAPGLLPPKTEQPISQDLLRHQPHILVADSGSKPFDHVNVIPGGLRWYVNDYVVKQALIKAGMGWARIPEHMIENDLKDGSLKPIQVENFSSQSDVPIYLIRLRSATHSQLAQALWHTLEGKC
ncbi:LysR family transcriptional regulator [Oceanospirillum sanctuarii]|uniref:LysR family transcriptional regulator n=1 Tax=Oceanospirillum sanctuarii TaxID=1434821 RepID=UPI000A3B16B5|nr:LysR family transcriptional regulator [Oceanospirillum sanctuarii]